jgi:LacI family transcriptional regulator
MTLDLMAQKHPPDAIFCANDMMALGCFDALSKLGLNVPNDVSVIGFDDREVAQFAHPPLTTLVLPHYEMGQIAATTLLDATSPNFSRPDRRRVECTLIDRSSVRVSGTRRRAAKPASIDAR